MATINNFDSLIRKLAAIREKGKSVKVIVGYTAAYAIFIHENMEIWPPGMRLAGKPRPKKQGRYWDPQGQARPKFLEEPARLLRNVLAQIVKDAMKEGKTLTQGLMLAGLRLMKESQQLVPVNFGNLRASAFTRIEE